MAIDKEIRKYLEQEYNKELSEKNAEKEKAIAKELEKMRPVGNYQMQKEALARCRGYYKSEA